MKSTNEEYILTKFKIRNNLENSIVYMYHGNEDQVKEKMNNEINKLKNNLDVLNKAYVLNIEEFEASITYELIKDEIVYRWKITSKQ